METLTIKVIERGLEEMFESEEKPPTIIMSSNLFEKYKKEIEETIRKGDFSSYIPPKKKIRRCRR